MTARAGELERPERGSQVLAWRPLPFVLLAIVCALYAATATVGAADTWIALACGRHIAAHGVNDTDPFSFNSRPSAGAALSARASSWDRASARWYPTGWINQNWLTHVVLYEAMSLLGYDSLFAIRVLVYLAVAALIWRTMKVQQVSPAGASLAILAVMVTMRGYLEMRPQDFTNLLVAAELLILALAVRGNLRVLWALVPIIVLWCNLHGGFVFGFMALAAFAAASAGAGTWVHRSIVPGPGWFRVTVAVAAVSLAGTVLLNPYHLSNVTHPLEVSVGPNAPLWRFVDEWRPIFAGGVATAEQASFLAFLIVVSLAGGTLLWRWQTETSSSARGSRRAARQEAPTTRQALDLFTLLIAGLTVVMAIESRRFIPIACICSAPLLGQGLDSLGVLITRLSPMAGKLGQRERVLRLGTVVLMLLLGTIWGWRFFQVYVRPWPHADGPSSLFARATWVHRRGFDVCQFIRENRLEGRMYNSWVEGGSLEWCQQPDPDSGRTPLQVFIDGRAQGAFPPNAMVRYLALEGGGPIGLTAIREGRQIGREETRQIGAWLEARLKEEGVSVVLLPEEDSQKPIMRGLLNRDNWQVAFLAPYHVLFVNVDTPRGRELIAGVSDGTTRFPNESSRLLTRSYSLFRRGDQDDASEGLSSAIRAFSLEPAALAVQTARRAAAFPQLVPRLDEFARGIVSDYQRNLKRYLSEPGFLKRNGAAVVAATYLRDAARSDTRPAEAASYGSLVEELEKERVRVWGRAFW